MTEPSGRVLLLRNNRLRGHIPQNLCSLSSIKILDLANTKLNRSIPSCLNNISFGRGSSHDNDHHPLALAWIMNWECIQGPWIYNLRNLQRVCSLNLSRNSFLGLTPESFSNLTDIESLDLSFNMLWGPILQDLGKLHNRVVFNASYNNLSGSIPTSKSRKTFYIG
ncbi:hypothetical protein YC2023_011160 [Brassica napus]